MSKKVTAKIWVLKHLNKIATQLDQENQFKGSQLVEDTMNKIADMDDDDFDKFFDDPDDFDGEEEGEQFGGDSRWESGGLEGDVVPLGSDYMDEQGDDIHSYMAAFIDGLAEGLYESIDDAMREAQRISKMYSKVMEDVSLPEPVPEEPKDGQVLEFKPREPRD